VKKFTVYTPVYNGSRYIYRVYSSLIKQQYSNFEWLIINDGSKDNSSQVIQELIKQFDADVNFIDLKENIGFSKSFNLAVKEAKGELFLVAHADDAFASETLQTFAEIWDGLSPSGKSRVQGIKCNCCDQWGSLIGDEFPEDLWEADIFDLLYKYKIKGEKWGFIRTDICREFPFPEDQKFIPESVIWHRMYFKYPAIFINKSLRTYFVDENPASLSSVTKDDTKYALGKRLLPLDFINHYFRRLNYDPKIVVTNFIVYWKFTFISQTGIFKALKEINKVTMLLSAIFFIIPGLLVSKKSHQSLSQLIYHNFI
jgi:glycosyltransferase involved in cell wall biosynthesis